MFEAAAHHRLNANLLLAMYYEPIDTILQKICRTQIRTLTFLEAQPNVPVGEYIFLPYYCTDPKCDCRRAMVRVLTSGSTKPLAVISYGWESKTFYRKWGPFFSEEDLLKYKGPALEPFQPQGPHAEIWLAYFQQMLKDPEYARRYIDLYTKFKWETGMKIPKDLQPYLGLTAPCLCESGELYKSCCGAKQARRRRRKLR